MPAFFYKKKQTFYVIFSFFEKQQQKFNNCMLKYKMKYYAMEEMPCLKY